MYPDFLLIFSFCHLLIFFISEKSNLVFYKSIKIQKLVSIHPTRKFEEYVNAKKSAYILIFSSIQKNNL